jgi:hypothetical protein
MKAASQRGGALALMAGAEMAISMAAAHEERKL